MVSSSNGQSRGSYQNSRRSEHGPLGEESMGSILNLRVPQEEMFSSLNIDITPSIDTETTKNLITTHIEANYSTANINIGALGFDQVDGIGGGQSPQIDFSPPNLETSIVNSGLDSSYFDNITREYSPNASAMEFDFPQATQSVFAEQFENGSRTVIKDFPLTSED